MSGLDKLDKLLALVAAEARRNPEFGRRVEALLGAPKPPARKPAALDPHKIYEAGWESMLRDRLAPLSEEQLRDIIAEYRLDPRGRSASWGADRLRDLIVEATSQLSAR